MERNSTVGGGAEPPEESERAPDVGAHSRGRIFRASVLLLSGHGASQATRLLGSLILTRLLAPEAFGMMQLVTVLLVGLHLFSDIGIGPAIVQSSRGDDTEFLDTAWTIQVIRGLGLAIACAALALPFARFYGEPKLVALLLLTSIGPFANGFLSTKVFTASRHLAQGRLVLLDFGTSLAGLLTAIALAYVYRDVWALVVSSLVCDTLRVLGSHLMLPGRRDRFHFDRTAAREMLRFGRWIFLSTLVTFLTSHADRLIFGKLVSLAMLGIYGLGSNIAGIVPTTLSGIMSGIVFPVYARVVQRGEELAPKFSALRRPLLVTSAWLMSGFLGGGPVMAELLYDRRYSEAGLVISILSIGSFVALVGGTTRSALLALGESRAVALSSLGKLLGMFLFLPLGYALFGFSGAMIGLSLAEVCQYAVGAEFARRRGFSPIEQDLLYFLWFLAAGGAAFAGSWASREFAACPPILSAVVVFLIVSAMFFRVLGNQVRALLELKNA